MCILCANENGTCMCVHICTLGLCNIKFSVSIRYQSILFSSIQHSIFYNTIFTL